MNKSVLATSPWLKTLVEFANLADSRVTVGMSEALTRAVAGLAADFLVMDGDILISRAADGVKCSSEERSGSPFQLRLRPANCRIAIGHCAKLRNEPPRADTPPTRLAVPYLRSLARPRFPIWSNRSTRHRHQTKAVEQ